MRTGIGRFFGRPERVFLVLAFLYGFIFLLITPPFEAPDEQAHFYRSYQVSEGGVLARKEAETYNMELAIINDQGDCYKITNGVASGSLLNIHNIYPDYSRGFIAKDILPHAAQVHQTGNPEALSARLFDGSNWIIGLSRNADGTVDANVNGSGEMVGAFLPASLQMTAERAMGDIPANPRNKTSLEYLLSLRKIPLNPADRAFAAFPNTALYSPIPYIPQAAGMAIGRVFDLSPLFLSYIGRAFNLLVWILLIYSAIRIAPGGKWLFFLLALMPMSLFQASSLSADAFTSGVSFLLISLFLRYSFRDGDDPGVSLTAWIIILASSVLLALSKQVYSPLVFLSLMVPAGNFSYGKKSVFIGILCAVSLSSMALWSLITAKVYVPLFFAEPARQVEFILRHPLEYAVILMKTIVNYRTPSSFIGKLGWKDTPLPGWLIWSYFIMLAAAGFAAAENFKSGAREKILMASTALAELFLVCTAVYMSAAKPGSAVFDFHGRYLIPFSPLFFLLLNNGKIRFDARKWAPALSGYSVLALSVSAFTLLNRYYLWRP